MSVEEEPLHSGKLPPREPGAITFQNVTFGYSTEHPILKLIQGFYQADSGTIAIDGLPLKDFQLHQLRRQFAYVLQNTPLFSGTIRDNITYGFENPVAEDEVIAAAKQAGLCSLWQTADRRSYTFPII